MLGLVHLVEFEVANEALPDDLSGAVERSVVGGVVWRGGKVEVQSPAAVVWMWLLIRWRVELISALLVVWWLLVPVVR